MESPERVLPAGDVPKGSRRHVGRLAEWDWRRELEDQERSLGWLGRHTNRSASAVARYASGTLTPPEAWLRDAARALGVEGGS